MLASVQIYTHYLKEELKKQPHFLDEMKLKFPMLDLPETVESIDKWYHSGDVIMDEDEISYFHKYFPNIDIRIKKIRGLQNIASKSDPSQIFQISVPNVGLMQILCVEVLEDACTQELQRWLDNNWRILAVCPPNDARRPTYIMGHFDKDARR